jgi:hypothetical protein
VARSTLSSRPCRWLPHRARVSTATTCRLGRTRRQQLLDFNTAAKPYEFSRAEGQRPVPDCGRAPPASGNAHPTARARPTRSEKVEPAAHPGPFRSHGLRRVQARTGASAAAGGRAGASHGGARHEAQILPQGFTTRGNHACSRGRRDSFRSGRNPLSPCSRPLGIVKCEARETRSAPAWRYLRSFMPARRYPSVVRSWLGISAQPAAWRGARPPGSGC